MSLTCILEPPFLKCWLCPWRVRGGKTRTSATLTSPRINNEESRVTLGGAKLGELTLLAPFSKMTKKTASNNSPNSLSSAGKSHERRAVAVPLTVKCSPVGGSGTATHKTNHCPDNRLCHMVHLNFISTKSTTILIWGEGGGGAYTDTTCMYTGAVLEMFPVLNTDPPPPPPPS